MRAKACEFQSTPAGREDDDDGHGRLLRLLPPSVVCYAHVLKHTQDVKQYQADNDADARCAVVHKGERRGRGRCASIRPRDDDDYWWRRQYKSTSLDLDLGRTCPCPCRFLFDAPTALEIGYRRDALDGDAAPPHYSRIVSFSIDARIASVRGAAAGAGADGECKQTR